MMAPAASRLTEPAWSPLSPPNFESSAFTASRTSIAALSRRLCASDEGCRHPSPHSSERLGPWWSGVVQEVENHSHALAGGRDVVRPVSLAGGIRAGPVAKFFHARFASGLRSAEPASTQPEVGI